MTPKKRNTANWDLTSWPCGLHNNVCGGCWEPVGSQHLVQVYNKYQVQAMQWLTLGTHLESTRGQLERRDSPFWS
jgi:hypothetical protein